MRKHNPGFIQNEKGRLTVQRFLDPVENVEQDRDQVAISLFHQLFHFKDRERGLTQVVRPGVQKHPHRPPLCVVGQSLAERLLLNGIHEMRQGAHVLRLCRQSRHGVMYRCPVGRQNSHPLEFQEYFYPVFCPRHLCRAFIYTLERREAEAVFRCDLIVISSRCFAERQERIAFVEGKNAAMRIAQELCGNRGQQRGFAGTCGAENHSMRQITVMEIEPERRGTVSQKDGQRRRIRRIKRARARRRPRPN